MDLRSNPAARVREGSLPHPEGETDSLRFEIEIARGQMASLSRYLHWVIWGGQRPGVYGAMIIWGRIGRYISYTGWQTDLLRGQQSWFFTGRWAVWSCIRRIE
jgi:hypothetical protein